MAAKKQTARLETRVSEWEKSAFFVLFLTPTQCVNGIDRWNDEIEIWLHGHVWVKISEIFVTFILLLTRPNWPLLGWILGFSFYVFCVLSFFTRMGCIHVIYYSHHYSSSDSTKSSVTCPFVSIGKNSKCEKWTYWPKHLCSTVNPPHPNLAFRQKLGVGVTFTLHTINHVSFNKGQNLSIQSWLDNGQLLWSISVEQKKLPDPGTRVNCVI